jgi:cytochrome c biogenesis protein CcmG, thiol:disulfide interchange protein DsbE
VLLVAVGALVAAEALSGPGRQSRGRQAPALPTRVLVPPRPDLAALRGRPVIVHFWASWCGPCRTEGAELASLARRLHGRAALVGVDWSDSPSGAAAFVRAQRWTFPDVEDRNGDAGTAWGLAGLPTTFIVDREGRIVRRLVGPQTARALLADVAG